MARDLAFWKYKDNTSHDDRKMYEELSSGVLSGEVEHLPVKSIFRDIKTGFDQWEWTDETTLENGDETIEIFMTDCFVRFDCYSVTIENLNRIIDIMDKYDCPLYDSAISVRFDGK